MGVTQAIREATAGRFGRVDNPKTRFYHPSPPFLGPPGGFFLGGHQYPPHRIEIAQSEQQVKLLSILLDGAISHLGVAERSLEDPERMLDYRPHRGQHSVQ